MDAEDENRPQLPEEPVASSSFSSIWNTSTPAEAIQLALSQQKLFLVWISPSTSDPAWDAIWTSPAIQSILAEHAVAITLAQGTPEAGMFLQLLASPPTATGVWIVFSGQLLDSFTEPPSSAEDMLQRINTTISKSQALKSAAFPPPYQPPASTSTSQQPPQSPTSTVSPEVAAQLAARRAKLEAAKLQYGRLLITYILIMCVDKLEKERLRLAAARQAESADPERQKYITQTAKERAQKKLEKEKILQEIENDKLERKKQQQQQHRTSTPTTPTKAHTPPPTTGKTKVAVRLPDSRILRGEFEGVKTLADVRAWIDETRKEPSAPPYVLQTTFPTRTFEVSEEHTETLSSILGKGGQVVLKVLLPLSFLLTYQHTNSAGDKDVFRGIRSSPRSRIHGILPPWLRHRHNFQRIGVDGTGTSCRDRGAAWTGSSGRSDS